MDLKDTVEMMISNDYRERFKAEYYQTKERYERLKHFCILIECSETGKAPVHDYPLKLLREQQHHMGMYLSILEKRAIYEKIEL